MPGSFDGSIECMKKGASKKKKGAIESILETVEFIKDKMVTKEELAEELVEVRKEIQASEGRLNQVVSSKIDGVHRRIDEDLDKRKALEGRVRVLETKLR